MTIRLVEPMANDDRDVQVDSRIDSLLRCPDCNREMRLFGVETASSCARELYTFECERCGRLEVRGVRTG